MRVAVIPARGGSKRIPRKNILAFNNKPMIAWTIEAALASNCFDRVIVSTDDAEIAQVAIAYGAEVPFMRPSALSDDFSTTRSVMQHALSQVIPVFSDADIACCLYATAPFLHAADIRRGLDALTNTPCDFALAVTSYAFPIRRALQLNADNQLELVFPEHASTRSQDLPEAFHDAGQFCWARARAWCGEASVFDGIVAPVILRRERVQDIDTLEDWRRAEWLLKAMLLEESQASQ